MSSGLVATVDTITRATVRLCPGPDRVDVDGLCEGCDEVRQTLALLRREVQDVRRIGVIPRLGSHPEMRSRGCAAIEAAEGEHEVAHEERSYAAMVIASHESKVEQSRGWRRGLTDHRIGPGGYLHPRRYPGPGWRPKYLSRYSICSWRTYRGRVENDVEGVQGREESAAVALSIKEVTTLWNEAHKK